jgi:hypothetical protein
MHLGCYQKRQNMFWVLLSSLTMNGFFYLRLRDYMFCEESGLTKGDGFKECKVWILKSRSRPRTERNEI